MRETRIQLCHMVMARVQSCPSFLFNISSVRFDILLGIKCLFLNWSLTRLCVEAHEKSHTFRETGLSGYVELSSLFVTSSQYEKTFSAL